MTSQTYSCQRCHLPLTIDAPLTNLSRAQSHLLTSQRMGYGSSKSTQPMGSEPFIPEDRRRLMDTVNNTGDKSSVMKWSGQDGGAESFVILPQFEGQDNEDGDDDALSEDDSENKMLSKRIKTLSTIFNLLNSKGELDYPVCKDCAQFLLASMQSQYDKTSKERDVYIQFLQKLQNKQPPMVSKSEESLNEITRLKKQEDELLKELQDLENEKDDIDKEILAMEKELEDITLQEQEFLKEENAKAIEITEFIKERDTITAEYEFNLLQLEKLRKTNVYNDTFHISHDGPFGTINGLRLGSLETIRVPWQEINAALGNVVLLLATVVTKLNIKLQGYRLKPMGSTSRIEKYERDITNASKPKVTILEAFSSGEYQIERLFNHSKLDNCMVALLDILSQVAEKLREFDSSIDIPYKMNKDKIGNLSVRLSSKTADEEWTNACKFLLTK